MTLEEYHWRSGPTTLLKHGHLEKIAQDYVQVAFEDFQGGASMASLGKLC